MSDPPMWSLKQLMPASSNRNFSKGTGGLWHSLSASAFPLTDSTALQSPTLHVNTTPVSRIIRRTSKVVPPVKLVWLCHMLNVAVSSCRMQSFIPCSIPSSRESVLATWCRTAPVNAVGSMLEASSLTTDPWWPSSTAATVHLNVLPCHVTMNEKACARSSCPARPPGDEAEPRLTNWSGPDVVRDCIATPLACGVLSVCHARDSSTMRSPSQPTVKQAPFSGQRSMRSVGAGKRTTSSLSFCPEFCCPTGRDDAKTR
mmetsp:Transcript_13647/g.39445  ORF Transcript_13647/g.39445 Transcript_13647/m.39445 type:complete len:258 (-) Transcript_13647:84-857(-)